MNLEQKHSNTRVDEVNPLDTSVSASRRRWTTFLAPGPARGGKCSWRRHFVGVPFAVMGYLQSLAARDAERFAYPNISTIARKAVPGRNLDRGYIGEVLEEFKNRLWVEPRSLERNGRQRRGWVIRSHEQVMTLSSKGGDLVAMKCGLSPQGVVTKSASETAENHPQSPDKKEVSSDGGGAESSSELTIEPDREKANIFSIFSRYGFQPNRTRYWRAVETKAASATWRTWSDDETVGMERVGLVEHFDVLLEALKECNWNKVPVHRSILARIEKLRPSVEELSYEIQDALVMRGVETLFEEDLTPANREEIARLKEIRSKSFERIGVEDEEPEEEILDPSIFAP